MLFVNVFGRILKMFQKLFLEMCLRGLIGNQSSTSSFLIFCYYDAYISDSPYNYQRRTNLSALIGLVKTFVTLHFTLCMLCSCTEFFVHSYCQLCTFNCDACSLKWASSNNNYLLSPWHLIWKQINSRCMRINNVCLWFKI